MQIQLWQDGLVAALAAVGVVSLLWTFTQMIFALKNPLPGTALAVLPARGDGGGLAEQIYALTGYGRDQGVIGRILVVDCGLNEEGRQLCRILERENRWVTVCLPEQAADHLRDAG